MEQLDNPVWHSLSETHQSFSIDYGAIKFYHPDYCPFGGFDSSEHIPASIADYSTLIDHFFIVGEKPTLPDSLVLKNELICLQMTIHNRIEIEINPDIIRLNEHYTEELFQLVTLVQPGYFKKKTTLLGDYFGIFQNGQLISAAGERMKMNGFTELSAIVTHPDHTGKGYAKQLIAHTVNHIFDQHKKPFLHVAETNIGAIRLYEKLGFITRRTMSFWNIMK